MPPSAAPEWLRVGCSFEIIATSAPASNAAMAARMPAQPAPTTRTSCSPITSSDATSSREGLTAEPRPGGRKFRGVEALEVVPEHPGEFARLRVVYGRIAPGRTRIQERRHDSRDRYRHFEAEDIVDAEGRIRELAGKRCAQHRPRCSDRHALALAERPAGPAGVDEPDDCAVLI